MQSYVTHPEICGDFAAFALTIRKACEVVPEDFDRRADSASAIPSDGWLQSLQAFQGNAFELWMDSKLRDAEAVLRVMATPRLMQAHEKRL